MAENYKHLYEQTKKMLEKYQDEIVPELRRLLDKRVEVIRCKECVKKLRSGMGNYMCARTRENIRFDDFCSYGERGEPEGLVIVKLPPFKISEGISDADNNNTR